MSHQLAEQLDTIGIIALMPGELPYQRVVEIADALLAAPLLAVQIVPNGPNTLDTLATFKQRAQGHMLIGADRVETIEQMDAVIDAGADFGSSSAEFKLPLLSQARKQGFFYIPTVHSPGQTMLAGRAGCRWQKVRDDIDVEGLEGMAERAAGAGYQPSYIINQIALEFVDAGFEAGAALCCINDIYRDALQPMGDIIRRARQARRAWLGFQAEQARR